MDYEFTSNRKCSLSEGYTYTTPTPDIHDRIYDTNTTRRQKAKKKKAINKLQNEMISIGTRKGKEKKKRLSTLTTVDSPK